jgi:hypothetical protein
MSVYILLINKDNNTELFHVITDAEYWDLSREDQCEFKKYSKMDDALKIKRKRDDEEMEDDDEEMEDDDEEPQPVWPADSETGPYTLDESFYLTGIEDVIVDDKGIIFYKDQKVGDLGKLKDNPEEIENDIRKIRVPLLPGGIPAASRIVMSLQRILGSARCNVKFKSGEDANTYYPGYYTQNIETAKWYASNYFKDGIIVQYQLKERTNYLLLTDNRSGSPNSLSDIIKRLEVKKFIAENKNLDNVVEEIDNTILYLKLMYGYGISPKKQQELKIKLARKYETPLRLKRGQKASKSVNPTDTITNRCSIADVDNIVMNHLCSILNDEIIVCNEVPTTFGEFPGENFHKEVIICCPENLEEIASASINAQDKINKFENEEPDTYKANWFFPEGTIFYKAFDKSITKKMRDQWLSKNACKPEIRTEMQKELAQAAAQADVERRNKDDIEFNELIREFKELLAAQRFNV